MTRALVAIAMLALSCAAPAAEPAQECGVRVEVGKLSELTLRRVAPVEEKTEHGTSISNCCGRFSMTLEVSESETLHVEGAIGEWCQSPVDFEHSRYLVEARREGDGWIAESIVPVYAGYLDYDVISKKGAEGLGVAELLEPLWIATHDAMLWQESPEAGTEPSTRLAAKTKRVVETLRTRRCAN